MLCPNCQTLSCYICRQVIHGYDHFSPSPGNKCALWDSPDGRSGPEQRHEADVAAARERALEQYKKDHPRADNNELRAVEVELGNPGGSKSDGGTLAQHWGHRPAVQPQQGHRRQRQQRPMQNAAGVPMVGLLDRGPGDFWDAGAYDGIGEGRGAGNAGFPLAHAALHLPIFRHPFALPPPLPPHAVDNDAPAEQLPLYPPAGRQGRRGGQARAPVHMVHRRVRINAIGGANRRR